MAADKWYRLTPDQIENLDKERTIVVLPLATLGSFDRETRLWEDLKAVRDDADQIVRGVNNSSSGPLLGYGAYALLPLWPGVEPGADQPGFLTLPRVIYEPLVEAICNELTKSGIKYVVLVVRNPDVEMAAQNVASRLNQDRPQPWVTIYPIYGFNY